MPDLDIAVLSAAAIPGGLVPQLSFRLRVVERAGGDVDAVSLRAQIMIEAPRRRYAEREQEALLDLFGEPERWGTTLRTFLWTHVTTTVPRFSGSTDVDLVVPSSFDLAVAASRYLLALDDGEVPLLFQFSGSVFWRDGEGGLQVAPISWSAESRHRLPVAILRELVESHYPDGTWLCVRRDVVDRLHRYRARRGLTSWEAAIDELLALAEVPAR